MENTADAILNYVAARAQEQWDRSHAPYLMSFIADELKKKGVNYKEVLGPDVKLATYLAQNSGGRFKVVRHAIHKAKIGLVPFDVVYDFDNVPVKPLNEAPSSSVRPRNKKYVVLNFLEALAELESTDLDKIEIPISVLAKLLASK